MTFFVRVPVDCDPRPQNSNVVAGLLLQSRLCCMPMRVGKTIGATFLFIDLMRHYGDFLLRRFEAEIRILG